MTILYLMLGIIVAAFCEFVLGNWRLPLPLIANVVFYITVANSYRMGVFAAFLGGMTLDLVYMRHAFFTPAAMFIVVLAAFYWKKERLTSPLIFNAVFGFILPAIMMFSIRIMQECTRAAIKLEFSGERISELILAGAVNAVILPVMIIFFDLIANKLEINTFSGWIMRQKNEDAE